jgi:nucleoside-diphosphate-sugar epimerase
VLAGVEPLRADVTQPQTLAAALHNVRPQLVLAVLTPGEFTDQRYRQVYVEGLRNLLGVLDTGALQRFIWVSSTSVYHQDDGGDVDEESPAHASGFSGKRLLEAEQLLASSGLPATIVRFGGIYGPGRDRLLRQLCSGVRSPASPARFSNRIHRDDCVGVLDFLLQRAAEGAPLQQLYLGVDREPAPIAEVERWFAGRLGLDYDMLQPTAAEARGGNRRCLSRRLQQLGYNFLYPTFREGLSTLLAP